MDHEQPKNLLHGVTLKALLTDLVDRYGWAGLAERIDVACFKNDPSLNSSLKFLRKVDWARAKLEALYLADLRRAARSRERNERRAERRVRAAEAEVGQAQPEGAAPEGSAPEE